MAKIKRHHSHKKDIPCRSPRLFPCWFCCCSGLSPFRVFPPHVCGNNACIRYHPLWFWQGKHRDVLLLFPLSDSEFLWPRRNTRKKDCGSLFYFPGTREHSWTSLAAMSIINAAGAEGFSVSDMFMLQSYGINTKKGIRHREVQKSFSPAGKFFLLFLLSVA